jgi:hypothetical protein
MKNLIFGLIAIVFFQNCTNSDKQIIKMNDIDFNLENLADNELICKTINEQISSKELKIELTKIELRNGIDEGSKNKYVYLFGIDSQNNNKVATLVEYDPKEKCFKNTDSKYVVCYGNNNCEPVLYNNNWLCDADLQTFECKKSVVVMID